MIAKCRQCGKEFEARNSYHAFCSNECRRVWSNDYKRMKRRSQRSTCKYCGNLILHYTAKLTGLTDYCSFECQRRAEKGLLREGECHLDEDIAEANKAGMSYGYYKAQKYLPKVNVNVKE